MFERTTTVPVFPTLIWVHELPEATWRPLNDRLAAALAELTGTLPPAKGFKVWQTDQTLHRYKAFAPLAAIISTAVRGVLDALAVEERTFEITGCWANFGLPGAAHMPHHHANNFLSGVYYLKAPGGADGIVFHDPRPQREIIEPAYRATNQLNALTHEVKVKTGSLVLFPGWITHSVNPNKGRELRISISFNIMFSDYAGTVSRPRWQGMPLSRPPDDEA